jgi:TolB-like protein
MKKGFGIVVFLLLLPLLCMAKGTRESEPPKQQTPQQTAVQARQAAVYWNGDGGKGIRLAVLEPTGKGLSVSEQWLLSMIQSSITGDFQKYSAMTIIDRQNPEKILGEQKQSVSGNYSEHDYIRIGKLTNARYILTGSVTKTSSAFMPEFAVTDVESGERKASYPPKAVSPSMLENLSAVKEATAELLRQLGVQLTNAGLQELNSTANTAQVKAETALAKGIEAQKQGTTVEALSYFMQASNYNSVFV